MTVRTSEILLSASGRDFVPQNLLAILAVSSDNKADGRILARPGTPFGQFGHL